MHWLSLLMYRRSRGPASQVLREHDLEFTKTLVGAHAKVKVELRRLVVRRQPEKAEMATNDTMMKSCLYYWLP